MEAIQVVHLVPQDGTDVQEVERKRNPKVVIRKIIANSVRILAASFGGTRRMANITTRTDRTVRYWNSEEREMGVTDAVMLARHDETFRHRLLAAIHMPEADLQRAEASINATERQINGILRDARAACVRIFCEARQRFSSRGSFRGQMVSAASAVKRGAMKLRFRRRAQEAV